jgi:hypothetical protein
MLRNKMEKFNEWEAENRRGLSTIKRLEQFIILYDLGKMHDDQILKKMNEDHLNSIIRSSVRFKNITLNREP